MRSNLILPLILIILFGLSCSFLNKTEEPKTNNSNSPAEKSNETEAGRAQNRCVELVKQ